MTEVNFYHLQRQSLEQVLPVLLEKSLDRGWNCVVECGTPERVKALDDYLWTFSEESFLPHGTDIDDAEEQPILLTTLPVNPNGAQVRFLVDGAPLPASVEGYERVMIVFDGNDPEALERARADWKTAKAAGLSASYFQQSDAGRWEKKA